MEDSAPSRRSIVIAASVVFALSVVLRVPSCYESFWLDELHSAWCVWDSIGAVFPRADLGHQSPFYFVGLWFWKQVFGESELALRMSSVLATAASGVVLTIGVTRWTKSVAAGVTAGCVIALESNSLFFGTELRPYAFVMLFSSLAATCFLRLVSVASRNEDRPAWIGLIVSILLAILCQPTAIGVLAWLPLFVLLVWLIRAPRQCLNFNLSDGFLILSTAAVGFALWRVTVGESWQQRTNWSSFAAATRVAEIWEVWDWTWLLAVPLGVLLVAWVSATIGRRSVSIRELTIATLLLALITVLATSLYWVVSRAEWVPVWHRRYFIAVLPVFACAAGGAIGVVEAALGPMRRSAVTAALIAIALILALPYQQGTLARLPDYPVALVTRGEDWREAIDWVRRNVEPNDLVLLDAGLIEANAWLAKANFPARSFSNHPSAAARLEYLVFAVSGPYDVRRQVVPVKTTLVHPSWISNRRYFIITRRPANRVNLNTVPGAQVFGFGNVSVIVQPSRALRRNIHPASWKRAPPCGVCERSPISMQSVNLSRWRRYMMERFHRLFT